MIFKTLQIYDSTNLSVKKCLFDKIKNIKIVKKYIIYINNIYEKKIKKILMNKINKKNRFLS